MIDLKAELNEAQYEAATTVDGPLLVIAGAGSGKTRTIVYRLAHMIDLGIPASAMLLLTFTRKAAQVMLQRAGELMGGTAHGVCGGTFHAFAYGILRHYRPAWLENRDFTVMDNDDLLAMITQCKDDLKLGKGDRSFPKSQNILGILSKARNKEISIEEVLKREATHLLPHAEALREISAACKNWRRRHALLDYDDLLFDLEETLRLDSNVKDSVQARFSHIMVDEYQDTNLVQARIARLLAGENGNIMAVGDDAQSIYAFRGANVRNILEFKKHFPAARIVPLEENYRSTQPILNLANAILEDSPDSYKKHLFTNRENGGPVRLVQPVSDLTQATMITRRIVELSRDYEPHEIAVLFRAGFHSYHLEMALGRAGIAFRKYGGLRYAEAAHIKDVAAFARLLINPLDIAAFRRVASMHRGVGPKTVHKLHSTAMEGNPEATEKAFARYPSFLEDMRFLDELRNSQVSPASQLETIISHYRPRLEENWPDDWPRRLQGLDTVVQMAADYDDLAVFLADLALDAQDQEASRENHVVLSTIHSAKGLEWKAVLILDLVEDRFPSRHAVFNAEDFEEERRLLYVAVTRARDQLDLYSPASVYTKDQGAVRAVQSPFIRAVRPDLYESWFERAQGALVRGNGAGLKERLLPPVEDDFFSEPRFASVAGPEDRPAEQDKDGAKGRTLGFCRHKIFGRGKMIHFIAPDKYQVNFPGFGLKVIMADYLVMEDS